MTDCTRVLRAVAPRADARVASAALVARGVKNSTAGGVDRQLGFPNSGTAIVNDPHKMAG
jgi:hypothetical protein